MHSGPGAVSLAKAATPWPAPSGSFYRYAPTAIEEGGYRYTYWCANTQSGNVTDSIVVRRDQRNGSSWSVGSEKVALGPGAAGRWDHRHVCDPDVVRGRFVFGGATYAYALFYTGLDKEQSQGGVNRVGWAVSNSLLGPFTRVSVSAALVSSGQWWGVGQPSVTSIDGAGKLLLFYTRGDQNGTRTLRRQVDLSNASKPVLGAELELPTAGLARIGGGADGANHGGALIYDPTRDIFWLVRGAHPFPSSCPDFISSQLQIATIAGASIWSGKGNWTVHANITGALMSGAARVFDGGFAKGPFGNPLANNRVDVIASTSTACGSGNNFATALWSYRTHGVTVSF